MARRASPGLAALKAHWLLLPLLFLVSAGVYLAVFCQVRPLIGTLGGDEPHYLLMAESLAVDGDLDLQNDYAERRYLAFYPLPLEHHTSPRTLPGHEYSWHTPGLPVVILPAYLLGKGLGDPRGWAAYFMCLVMALTAVNIYLLAYETTAKRAVALLVWGILALLTGPILWFSSQIYPDVVAALITIYAVRQLLNWPRVASWQVGLTALGLALLSWLHPRYLPTVALLLLIGAAQTWRGRRQPTAGKLAILFGGVAASVLAQCFYDLQYFNVFWPEASSAQSQSGLAAFFNLEHFKDGVWGLLIDRRSGLFVAAPVLFPAFASLVWLMMIRRRRDAIIVGLVALSAYLLVASSQLWPALGGFPLRYLLYVLPLAALPLAVYVDVGRGLALRALLALAVLLGVLIVQRFLTNPLTLYQHNLSLIAEYSYLFPAAVRFNKTAMLLLATWLAFLTLLGILVVWLLSRGERAARRERSEVAEPAAWRPWQTLRVGAGRLTAPLPRNLALVAVLLAFVTGFAVLPLSRSRQDFIASFVQTWPAPQIAHFAGEVKPDSQAPSGQALDSGGTTGYLAYGPHISLPAGPYQIVFWLRATPGSAAVVQVVTAGGNNIKQRLRVQIPGDGAAGYQAYKLDFISANEHAFEFQILVEGGRFWLDSIALYPRY